VSIIAAASSAALLAAPAVAAHRGNAADGAGV
jgi:hypothetical protein